MSGSPFTSGAETAVADTGGGGVRFGKPEAKPSSTWWLLGGTGAEGVGAEGAGAGWYSTLDVGGDASPGSNSTVNVEPGPKPGGMTIALTLPSGACT